MGAPRQGTPTPTADAPGRRLAAPAVGRSPKPEPLLTIPEAARLLRVSTHTVRRRIADGQLEARRVGALGPLRIPARALGGLLRPAHERPAA